MRKGFAFMLAAVALIVTGCKKSDVDLSSPKAAAMTFGKAMDTGDAPTALAASTNGDPRLIETLAKSASSIKKLHDVAIAKFGPEGDSLVTHGESAPVDFEKPIADSDVEIDGDSALLTSKSDPSTPLKLKKVEGNWKVDVASLKGISDLGPMVPAMQAVTAANSTLANDITAGKYATVAEALKAKTTMTLAAINSNSPGGASDAPPAESSTDSPPASPK